LPAVRNPYDIPVVVTKKERLMTNKYLKEYPYSTIDVYRVLIVFGVSDPGIQHAIKKLLFAGQRGTKDYQTDLKEAIQAIERSIKMEQETIALGY
jgi:ABC-type glycerol-3-phosphate transport system substrate-binding protein